MATVDYHKDLAGAHVRIEGGTTSDSLVQETITYEWSEEGGSIQVDGHKEQSHPPAGQTLKPGTTVVIDKANKTVSIREVT